MRFSKWVFRIAFVYGLLSLPPLYFMEGLFAETAPPAITHAEFYYAFISLALAWQFVFLAISIDPLRYRWLMLPAIAEKFTYSVPLILLALNGRMDSSSFGFWLGQVDWIFVVLFTLAFIRTRKPGAA